MTLSHSLLDEAVQHCSCLHLAGPQERLIHLADTHSLLVLEVKWSKVTQAEPPYKGGAHSSKISGWFTLSFA